MQDKAIVFGGAGFIGSHLLRRLARAGGHSELFSLDLAEPRHPVEGVRYLRCDVRKPIPPEICGTGPFEIFNLAAVHTTPGHEDWEYFWTNVLGGMHVCSFASAVGAIRMVFTSSISVYGPSEGEKDEGTELAPESAYGRSKLLAEHVHNLWRAEKVNERILTIARPAVIYGVDERGNFTRLARMLKRGLFLYPGRTDTVKACGYVEDLVSSMLYMHERNRGLRVYNFCHPQSYTTEQICAAFCDVAQYKAPFLVVPNVVIMAAARFFEVLTHLGIRTSINRARVRKLQYSTNIVPRQLLDAGFQYAFDLKSSLAHWKQASSSNRFE